MCVFMRVFLCVCICRREKTKQAREFKTHKQNISFMSSSCGNNTQRRLCTKYGLLKVKHFCLFCNMCNTGTSIYCLHTVSFFDC